MSTIDIGAAIKDSIKDLYDYLVELQYLGDVTLHKRTLELISLVEQKYPLIVQKGKRTTQEFKNAQAALQEQLPTGLTTLREWIGDVTANRDLYRYAIFRERDAGFRLIEQHKETDLMVNYKEALCLITELTIALHHL